MRVKFLAVLSTSLILSFVLHSCRTNNNKEKVSHPIQNNQNHSDSTQIDSTSTDQIKLEDKNIKFLWRENKYNDDLKMDINTIVLNEDYIKTISEPEKAVLALVATFVGNECEWAGKANENRSNLKCKILWALNLGYQCSSTHLDFLRKWFRGNKEIIEELANCPTTPDGATIQDTFDEINIEVKGIQIIVSFKVSGFNIREEKGWKWTEKDVYELQGDEILLIAKDISPKTQRKN